MSTHIMDAILGSDLASQYKKYAEVLSLPPKVHAVNMLAAVRDIADHACSRRTYSAHN